MRTRSAFFLILVHSDLKRFFVSGPMFDDAVLTERVCELQDRGERVSCFADHDPATVEQAIESAARLTGYSCAGAVGHGTKGEA